METQVLPGVNILVDGSTRFWRSFQALQRSHGRALVRISLGEFVAMVTQESLPKHFNSLAPIWPCYDVSVECQLYMFFHMVDYGLSSPNSLEPHLSQHTVSNYKSWYTLGSREKQYRTVVKNLSSGISMTWI